jgi:hypothetical protein
MRGDKKAEEGVRGLIRTGEEKRRFEKIAE